MDSKIPWESEDKSEQNRTFDWLKSNLWQHRGLFAVVLASICCGLQTIWVKFVTEIPFEEAVFAKSALQGVISVTFCLSPNLLLTFLPSSKRELWLLLARGLSGTVSVGFMYFALYSISSGVVTTITLGAPVFVGILGWIILRETFYCYDVILLVINFASVLLIVQPPFLFPSESMDEGKKTELLGVAAAFGAMIFTSFSSIFLRLLGLMEVNATKIVLYFALCGTTVSAAAGIFTQRWLIPQCGRIRFLMVGIGLMSYLYHYFLSYAFAATKKSYFVSLMSSIQVPITIIMELFILGVAPDLLSGIGMFGVICSACGVVLRESRVAERDQPQAIELREEVQMRLELEADLQGFPENQMLNEDVPMKTLASDQSEIC